MIEVEIISKKFGLDIDSKAVIKNISLKIKKNEFLGIFGPNGCGKTTFVKIISGIDKQFEGDLTFNENNLKIGFVFQNYSESLFPWLNNFNNISYFLKINGMQKHEIKNKIFSFLTKYDINIDLKAYPNHQSGGQQQLVSLLRAMVYEPELLILDESFSSLDEETKLKFTEIIQQYQDELRNTIIFISHNLEEVSFLCDRILVMKNNSKDSVLGLLDIPFNKPRKLELKDDIDFFKFNSNISSALRKEILNK